MTTPDLPPTDAARARILYCHCTYANVVPSEVKHEVLAKLSESGVGFEAVADLCEMSARNDPALARLACSGTKIAACFPRAVKWLFHAADVELPADVVVLNMREQSADEVLAGLFGDGQDVEQREVAS